MYKLFLCMVLMCRVVHACLCQSTHIMCSGSGRGSWMLILIPYYQVRFRYYSVSCKVVVSNHQVLLHLKYNKIEYKIVDNERVIPSPLVCIVRENCVCLLLLLFFEQILGFCLLDYHTCTTSNFIAFWSDYGTFSKAQSSLTVGNMPQFSPS